MKLSTAAITSLLFVSPGSVVAHPDKEDSSPTIRSHLRKTQINSSSTSHQRFLMGPAANRGKGSIQARGKFGKIDVSNVVAAQAGSRRILEALGVSSPNNKYVPKNSNANHVRFVQKIHGMVVEGASMMVHSDPDGNVFAVNGELVDDSTVPSAEPTIDFATAIAVALAESRVPSEFHGQCGEPSLTIVRGLDDGEAHLAWTCIVRYDVLDEEGYYRPFRDQIFAHADGEAGLIQIHSLIYGALAMNTKTCFQITTLCSTVSTSNTAISTSDRAINDAHNYAIDTYNYYKTKFGRDSINGAGMTLVSRVHYDVNYNNAFWDGSQMTYGDGDGVTFSPLSQDLDVVAHELTHGITEWESGLIYSGESGALNEAMSDIFAALVEKWKGQSDDPTNNHINDSVWKVGENIYTPSTAGDAMRYMFDPQKQASGYDYYPDRYKGTADNGGVHWNSGIANLAAYLMVAGGGHPRGLTPINVNPLGGGTPYSQTAYDAIAKAFYFANTECLTPSSTFETIRFCTVEVHKPDLPGDSANIANAWAAVGVVKPSVEMYTVPITNMALTGGQIRHYYMDVTTGQTVSCSTNGPNGDADLFMRFGDQAIPDSAFVGNACSSVSGTSMESCSTAAASAPTRVYAAVHAWSTFSGLTFQCTNLERLAVRGYIAVDKAIMDYCGWPALLAGLFVGFHYL
ncbi:hypothetical protein ACHAW5_004125 [Stephanodiscus triporus]|uniref:Neutral metalloproteinase n=1 Tax=Stephanodiscus triporus TaxID=2934178 RepID=A0ABD3QMF7_9STRA